MPPTARQCDTMHGFLNIDKPAGITSHDVVARVRRLAGQRRVGHAGTLDPLATGVLVVALGGATRLIEYVQNETRKRYLAVVRLGVTTATDDAEGAPLAERPVPPLAAGDIERTLAGFRGEIMQTPPAYSALHLQGHRLYDLARAGVVVDIPPRPVIIEQLHLVRWEPPLLTLDIACGKGTYIRSLARDIGAALGCGGHLAALRRTAVGPFRIEDAVALDLLEGASGKAGGRGRGDDSSFTAPLLRAFLPAVLQPPEAAVADWPRADLDAAAARRVRNGLPLALPGLSGDRARAHGPDGALLALLHRAGDAWKPEKVFSFGDG